jgi:hypothetical protein
VVSSPGERDDASTKRQPERGARDARRRPSAAEVFGDVLPDTTGDERGDVTTAESQTGEDARDAEIRRDVPPHHG